MAVFAVDAHLMTTVLDECLASFCHNGAFSMTELVQSIHNEVVPQTCPIETCAILYTTRTPPILSHAGVLATMAIPNICCDRHIKLHVTSTLKFLPKPTAVCSLFEIRPIAEEDSRVIQVVGEFFLFVLYQPWKHMILNLNTNWIFPFQLLSNGLAAYHYGVVNGVTKQCHGAGLLDKEKVSKIFIQHQPIGCTLVIRCETASPQFLSVGFRLCLKFFRKFSHSR